MKPTEREMKMWKVVKDGENSFLVIQENLSGPDDCIGEYATRKLAQDEADFENEDSTDRADWCEARQRLMETGF